MCSDMLLKPPKESSKTAGNGAPCSQEAFCSQDTDVSQEHADIAFSDASNIRHQRNATCFQERVTYDDDIAIEVKYMVAFSTFFHLFDYLLFQNMLL